MPCKNCIKLQQYYGKDAKCNKCSMNDTNWKIALFVFILGNIVTTLLVLYKMLKDM